MAEKMTRRQISNEEAGMIANHNFEQAKDKLGISDGHEIDRGQWVDALPYIQRALKMTEGAPKKRSPRKPKPAATEPDIEQRTRPESVPGRHPLGSSAEESDHQSEAGER